MNKKEYFKYLNSEDWKERRKGMMVEANWICENCGGKAVELHHISWDNLGYEVFGVDVIPLCKECHEEEHPEKGYGEYGEYKGYGEW